LLELGFQIRVGEDQVGIDLPSDQEVEILHLKSFWKSTIELKAN